MVNERCFSPSTCELLSKQAGEGKGHLLSPVSVLLFNYYCFQIPLSIHSSIYVLIDPFNNQKIETTKVARGVLPALPLHSSDKLSVANVSLPHGTWLLSTGISSAHSLCGRSCYRKEEGQGESSCSVL